MDRADWKRYFLIGSGFGVGFAIIFVLIFGGVIWYQGRPKTWNNSAIKAFYEKIGTGGEDNTLIFYYTVENTSPFDWTIDPYSDAVLMVKLEDSKSLTGPAKDEFISFDKPIFLPAKQRLLFRIRFKYSYDKKLKSHSTREERKEYRKKLESYVAEKWPNLNGFVLYDKANQYQIDFPRGWPEIKENK